jgi:hypothetical protein
MYCQIQDNIFYKTTWQDNRNVLNVFIVVEYKQYSKGKGGWIKDKRKDYSYNLVGPFYFSKSLQKTF